MYADYYEGQYLSTSFALLTGVRFHRHGLGGPYCRIRDELGSAEGYAVQRLFEQLRRAETNHADRLVRLPPRRRAEEPAAALREEPPGAG